MEVQDSLLRSDWLRRYVQNSASGVLDISATVLGGLFQVLTIFLFSFYFAADGPRLRRALCSVLPPARQTEVLRAWEIAVDKTGGYIYSRGLMALISGGAHYVLLEILGVPYAPALAVWVGLVSQFIPTIGTYLAGALPMLIAFTVNPWYALWVLGFVVVYQQFENYVLQPKLTSKTVDIHPAVAFGSVVAGTALLGAVGALVAIPAVATLQAFLGAYVKRYEVTDDPRVHGHRHRGGRTLRRMRDVLGKKRDAPGAGKNAPAEAAHEAEPPEGAAREGSRPSAVRPPQVVRRQGIRPTNPVQGPAPTAPVVPPDGCHQAGCGPARTGRGRRFVARRVMRLTPKSNIHSYGIPAAVTRELSTGWKDVEAHCQWQGIASLT